MAAIISHLERSKTISPRFNWAVPTINDAYHILLAAYRQEVQNRGRQYEDVRDTKMCLWNIAHFCVMPGYKTGIVLCGRCGNGKTTALHALQQATNTLIDFGLCSKHMGIHIIDAMELLHTAQDYKAYCKKREYPVIAIEDLGKEPTEVLQYGNRLSPVIDLLEYRYTHLLPTFVTTNLAPDDIKTVYDLRLADRFRETMQIISFPDTSYRK